MKKFILFPLLGIATLTIFVFVYQIAGFTFLCKNMSLWPRPGWKKITGCVATPQKEIKYQFYGKENWYLVTKDMGCKKQYPDAESWGLQNLQIDDTKSDIAQITVLLFDIIPSEYNRNTHEYLAVPSQEGIYLELGRITAIYPTEKYGISDKEWKYVKNSFKFK